VYRQIAHRLALQKKASLIDIGQFSEQDLAEKIQRIQIFWQQLLEPS